MHYAYQAKLLAVLKEGTVYLNASPVAFYLRLLQDPGIKGYLFLSSRLFFNYFAMWFSNYGYAQVLRLFLFYSFTINHITTGFKGFVYFIAFNIY